MCYCIYICLRGSDTFNWCFWNFPKMLFFYFLYFSEYECKHFNMFSWVRFSNFCFVLFLQPLIGQKNRSKLEFFINNCVASKFENKKNSLWENIANVTQIKDIFHFFLFQTNQMPEVLLQSCLTFLQRWG